MEAHIFEQQFEALLRRYIQFIIRDIQRGIQRARDKQHMKISTKEWVENVLNRFQDDEIIGELCETFVLSYKEGEDIRQSIIEIHKAYITRVSESPNSYYEEELIKPKNKKQASFSILLIKALLRYLAFTEVHEQYDKIITEPVFILAENNALKETVLNWTNIIPSKENKNEFVQLIYALHRAGYINHGRGEITKIVEAAADVFNLKLGNNWQSNHSASIHKAKRDYEPPIFRKIQEAYKLHTNDLIEEKRRRR